MNELWYATPFNEVDAKDIGGKADKFAKTCMRLEKNLDPNPIQMKLKALVDTFKEAMPIVSAMRNDKLTEGHWGQIKALIQKDFDVALPDFTLKSLIDLDVTQFREEIVTISTQATQEANLRGQLEAIKEVFAKLMFDLKFEDKCECWILSDMDPIFEALDQTLAEITAILGSRFVKPLRSEAEVWQRHILHLSDMIDEWLACQKNWMYLQNIFKAPDIKKQLMDESKKFDGVDKFFRQLMGGPTGA